MTAAIVLGAFAGRWLDERFGTAPLAAIGFAFAGLGVGAFQVIRRSKQDDPSHPDPP